MHSIPETTDSQESQPSAILDESTAMHSPLTKQLELGLYALIDQVRDNELERNHHLAQSKSQSWWRLTGVPFLAAIPADVLSGIVHGNLARRWLDGAPELTKLYGEPSRTSPSQQPSYDDPPTEWLTNASKVAPGHYVRYLLNSNGDGPSPNQLHQATSIMRQYATSGCDEKLAYGVDNALKYKRGSTEASIKAGHFYFLCPDPAKRLRSQDRIDKILKFCESLNQRIEQAPRHLWDKPDNRPLSYTGYALVVNRRLAEHDGESTSYLMALIEHVFRYLDFETHFQWEDFVTSYCTSYDEACLGEVLVNALARSYYDTSYGVAVHPAGMNCTSALLGNKLHSDVKDCWAECTSFREDKTPFLANVATERQNVQRFEQLNSNLGRKRNDRTSHRIAKLRALITSTKPRLHTMCDQHAQAMLAEELMFSDNVKAPLQTKRARLQERLGRAEDIIASLEDVLMEYY